MTIGVIQKLRDGLAWGQEAQRIINYGLALIRDASATAQGLIEIATDAEAIAKTATDKALVPSNLAALDASDTFAGLIEIATDVEAAAVTATDKALVPSNFSGKAGQQTYVEGTFTAGITFGGAAVGVTYGAQVGSYTRIGRLIAFELIVVLTAKGSSTGSAQITGLPETVGADGVASIHIDNMTSGVGDSHVQAVIASSSTVILLRDVAAGEQVNLTEADFTDTSQIRISGVYRV